MMGTTRKAMTSVAGSMAPLWRAGDAVCAWTRYRARPAVRSLSRGRGEEFVAVAGRSADIDAAAAAEVVDVPVPAVLRPGAEVDVRGGVQAREGGVEGAVADEEGVVARSDRPPVVEVEGEVAVDPYGRERPGLGARRCGQAEQAGDDHGAHQSEQAKQNDEEAGGGVPVARGNDQVVQGDGLDDSSGICDSHVIYM